MLSSNDLLVYEAFVYSSPMASAGRAAVRFKRLQNTHRAKPLRSDKELPYVRVYFMVYGVDNRSRDLCPSKTSHSVVVYSLLGNGPVGCWEIEVLFLFMKC